MKTLKPLLYKDFLLMIRDKTGLLLLFLMPMVLVLVMTGMQEGVVNNSTQKSFSLILLDEDQDSIGSTIVSELQNSDIFNLTLATEMTEQEVQQAVKKGDFLVGVVIPKDATKTIRRNVQISVAAAFAGIDSKNVAHKFDSVDITIFIDPTTSPTFQATLMSNVREASSIVENKYIFNEISKEIKQRSMIPLGDFNLSTQKGISIKEKISDCEKDTKINLNVAQHNVPAWTLFAIFFIVVSLSGNIIKEREDGSFSRLMSMPCSYTNYLLSKVLIYLCVCILQFLFIVAMGLWLFPLINMPTFCTEGRFFELLFVVVCAAFTAIGFGILISTFATTHQQAAIFGSVSVVILAAIGGIWVPIFLMPNSIELLSNISPLNWGINAFYDILLRNAPFATVLVKCLYLLIFSTVCFSISIHYQKEKI